MLKTVNPATGEPVASYETISDARMLEVLEACHAAFERWRHVSLEDRAAIINSIADGLETEAEDLARLMTTETGKLLSDSRQEVELCAAICRWTAKTGPDALADDTKTLVDGRRGIVSYAPLGVIYGIQPWNFPAYQAIRYAIASLMAGNGVLLKHAEICTGSGLLLRDIMERSGLPENLFTVMLIDHDQSDTLIAHDLVRGVTLTGSGGAGRHVGEKSGAAIKKTVLELGSNDAYLVLADADLQMAVKTAIKGRVYNNGQTCVNAKRFVVVDSVYDEFVRQYVEGMKALTVGDPEDETTDLGPMSNAGLRDELHDQVKESLEKGARLECGGEIPDRKGAWYPATVLTNVLPGQPAYDDELFGPVASIIRAKDTDDALRIANDSRYGLGGGIFSADEDKAVRIARDHFDTRMVFINQFNLASPDMPFGGVKDSGYGREHGGFGIKEFVNAKAITLPAANDA
ncbi:MULTISPECIES: NAD-dependent succinate-semialdehyde dehydrogenase [unclassified Roseibium]|uniref:NAD-dependent succinate-semialdehyde dehydrogenase n=1 Tax=unclassified Roseibium TaxID=2629323 RepID=UPI00273FEBF3|nr:MULTISPECIES: NAD-dependent succinate-semialdehyde dehydrogenase [unclassified Roseibium]